MTAPEGAVTAPEGAVTAPEGGVSTAPEVGNLPAPRSRCELGSQSVGGEQRFARQAWKTGEVFLTEANHRCSIVGQLYHRHDIRRAW